MALQTIHNEPELLTRISLGDEKAFGELFRAYHHQLGVFVNGLVDSKEMTEEIVQDVFVKIWTGRRSLPEIEKFTSYLFIQTRNYTLNCIRKRVNDRNRKQKFLEVYDNHFSDENPFTDNEPEYLSLLDRAIAQLPCQQQRVFELRKEGLKNPEIAKIMGIHVDSVKKYQQLALRSVSDFVKVHVTVGLMLSVYAN